MAGRKKRKDRKFTKKMQIKLMVLFAFILFILVGLNIKIALITAKSGDTYTKQVLSQQQYDSRAIPYRRGDIQDTNGNVLAQSEKVYNVVMDCLELNNGKGFLEPTVHALVEIFELDEADIRKRLTDENTKTSQYQVLARGITLEKKKAFEEYASPGENSGLSKEEIEKRQKIQGVWFEEYYIRKYPMNTMASNVIGFSNNANDGICGLEAYYSDVLNGVNGREYGYLNEDSELKRTVIEPEHGNTIVTTLDVNIQEIVEKYIQEFDEEYVSDTSGELEGKGSKNTGVIVGNPNTGEIYAMASNHGFDLNNPQDMSRLYTKEELEAEIDQRVEKKRAEEEKKAEEREKAESEGQTTETETEAAAETDAETGKKLTAEEKVEKERNEFRSQIMNEMWSNFCVSDAFEPGSTFKPITVSSALETGALTGDEMFMCDGGRQVADWKIKCDNIYGHGEETVIDAIKNSCNDALMEIGFRLGVENFCKYQRLFNFGRVTGIDLPNESTGNVYTREGMHEVELATNSFGQGFTCTMVQEFAAFSAVVNGGYYYQPHLVRQVLDANGGVAKSVEPLLMLQPISARTSSILREALEAGVREGTGRKAKVPGYRVGGKTGTAEKINPETGKRWEGKYLVSFIGCVPIDDPQVVIYVVVDEPNVADQSTGGYAHIIARKILQEILPYLNIYPTEEVTDEELNNIGITREEAEIGRQVETQEPETDENGNVIETEPETDENGNVIETEPETDENGNAIQAEEQPADNPDIAAPPPENDGNSEGMDGAGGVTSEDLGLE